MMRKTKKAIAVVLAIIMTLAVAPVGSITGLDIGIRSSAAQLEPPYTYSIVNGEAIITNISTLSGDVTIPATFEGYPVTEIWGHGHYDITSIIIPDTVTRIGKNTFSGCTKLTGIELPEKLEIIESEVFSGCSSLTEIKIPASVTSIGWLAFEHCPNLKRIIVDEKNEAYSSDENGVLFNKDKSTLLKYPQGSESTSYEIPDSVTYIEGWSIRGVKNLEIVTIPKSVKSISDTNYGFSLFEYCPYLKKIIVDEENQKYSSDDAGALFDKDKTILYRYPHGNDATAYVVPDSVTRIYQFSFERNIYLESITIPGSVTTIDDYAFSECRSLKDVKLCNGLKYINKYAFYSCEKMETITIPGSVETIGQSAFKTCRNLTNVTIENGVKAIGYAVFADCYELKSIEIPESVISISLCAFQDTNLSRITVDENNPNFSSDQYGVLYNKDKTVLIKYPDNAGLESFSIPDTVTTIESDAFDYIDFISLEIPGSITNMHYRSTKVYTHDIYYAGTQEQWESIEIQKGAVENGDNHIGARRFHYNAANAESHWTSASVPATCTEDGETTYTCPCGFSYTEVLPATGHVDENADGKCDVCGETTDAVKNCTCNCHKSGFTGFVYKIIRIFWRLFKTNEVCACGVKH